MKVFVPQIDRPFTVRGTEIQPNEKPEIYLQKLARIAHDEMFQLVAILTTSGTLLECNRAALDAGGLTREEVIGKPFWETFWWTVTPKTQADLRQAISRAAHGEIIRYEVGVYGRKGGKETMVMDFTLLPIRDEDGRIVFLLPEGRDITDKKAHEREIARQKEELAELTILKTQTEKARLLNILEQAPTAICLLQGPNHIYTLTNPHNLRLFGGNRTVLHKSVRTAVPEVEGQGFFEILDRVYQTGEPFTGNELPVALKQLDGTVKEFILDVSYQPMRNAVGEVEGILGVHTDVTDKVLAREAIRIQKQALQLALNEAPLESVLDLLVKLVEAQPQNKTLASVLLVENNCLYHGAAPSLPDDYNREVHGIPIGPTVGSCGTAAYFNRSVIVSDIASDPLWKDFRDLALGHNLLACWSTPILSSRNEVLGIFALYQDTPGYPSERHQQIIEVATQTAAIVIERQRDMNRRKTAEAAMRESEERLNLALTSSNTGILDWNIKSGHIELNETFMQDWGINPATFDHTLEGCLISIHPEDRERVRKELQKVATLCTPFDVEHRVIRPSGEIIWINGKGRCSVDEQGKPDRLTGVSINITERKIKESELERSNAELARFAFVASHDLKEPIRVVSNYVQMLAYRYQGKLDDSADTYIRFTTQAVDRMYELINDLLSYSRVGANEPEFGLVDTRRIIDEAISNLGESVKECGAEISCDKLPTVVADASQYSQLFQNLIANAIKYRALDRAPKIKIEANRRNGELVFSVEDNGIGIAKEHYEKIFVLFQRLHNKDRYSGTGIGLAVCKKIVDRHGGKIWVNSEEGKGSTFFFTAREAEKRTIAVGEALVDH